MTTISSTILLCPTPHCETSSEKSEFRRNPQEKQLYPDRTDFLKHATKVCNACYQKALKGKDPTPTIKDLERRQKRKWTANNPSPSPSRPVPITVPLISLNIPIASEELALDYLAYLVNFEELPPPKNPIRSKQCN
jgi:hypothetical protein